MYGEVARANEQRFAALLLFQFRVEAGGQSNRRRICEKRLIVFPAANGRSALRTAKRRGREAQHRYINSTGGRVHVEFVGVLDLLHLGIECGPDEVWYQVCELLEPMERRDRLIPAMSDLQAVAEERQRRRVRHGSRRQAHRRAGNI
jgi:Domain of unknown function (DUF4288)